MNQEVALMYLFNTLVDEIETSVSNAILLTRKKVTRQGKKYKLKVIIEEVE